MKLKSDSLNSLVISSLDEINQVKELQQILKIALDRNAQDMALLMNSYLILVEEHINDLDELLQEIKLVVRGEK